MFDDLHRMLTAELGENYLREYLLWIVSALVGAQCVRLTLFRVVVAAVGALRPKPGDIAIEVLKQLDGEVTVSDDGSKILADKCEVVLPQGVQGSLIVFVAGDPVKSEQLSPRDHHLIRCKHAELVRQHRQQREMLAREKTLNRLRGAAQRD